MKPIIGLAFAAMLVLPAFAAFAQDSTTTVIVPSVAPKTAELAPKTPDLTPATAGDDKMVCHAGRPMMGTHFSGPRVCKTQRQWDAEHREAQAQLEKNQGRGCLASGVCPDAKPARGYVFPGTK